MYDEAFVSGHFWLDHPERLNVLTKFYGMLSFTGEISSHFYIASFNFQYFWKWNWFFFLQIYSFCHLKKMTFLSINFAIKQPLPLIVQFPTCNLVLINKSAAITFNWSLLLWTNKECTLRRILLSIYIT